MSSSGVDFGASPGEGSGVVDDVGDQPAGVTGFHRFNIVASAGTSQTGPRLWAPGTETILGDHPAAGAAFGTGASVDEGLNGARQTLGTQTGDGMAHRMRRRNG